MFKTPEWEDDVPKTHTSFIKKNEGVKKKNEKKEKKSVEINTKVSLKINKIKGKKLEAKRTFTPKVNNVKGKKPIVNNKKVFNDSILKGNKEAEIKKRVSNVNNVIEKENNVTTNGLNKPSRKRKLDNKTIKTKKKKSTPESQNFDKISDTQNFDEILLNAKKKKFNEVIENDDQEDILFSENKQKKKKKKQINNNDSITNGKSVPILTKKDRLKAVLETGRRHINVGNKSSRLRERMLERLKAAQFRYLNEKLYTSSGSEAQQLFQEDPGAFETYHQGYQLQVKKWPVNPLDVIVKKIMKMPKSHLIADMGCGEAALSRRVPHTTRSFDLVATAPGVEPCDMARTPLLAASVDVAVYCLALMGTDLTQYLVEANRVLKMGGHLLIAEVESRFDNVDNFTKEVQRLGFKLKQLDKSNNVFFFMEFTKTSDPPVKKAKLPTITLKPCLYKRR